MTPARPPPATRRWHRRGHPIVRLPDGRWRWVANGRYASHGSNADDPACTACGRFPNTDGSDACIGHVPGATGACCGHGVVEGYVAFRLLGRVRLPEPRTRQLGVHGELIDRVAEAEAVLSHRPSATVRVRRPRSSEIRRRQGELRACLVSAFEASPLGARWGGYAAEDVPRAIDSHDRHPLLVAETETGRIAAVAMGTLPPRRPPLRVELHGISDDDVARCGELRWLAVDPRFRRQGLAERLIHEVASDLTVDRLWLAVEKANTTALTYYLAHGWADIGEGPSTRYLVRQIALPRKP